MRQIFQQFLGGLGRTRRIGVCLAVSLVCGCGPPPAEIVFRAMMKQTKETYSASQIVSAVMPLFSTNGVRRLDKTNKIPQEIAKLPLFAKEGSYIDTSLVGNKRGEPRGIAFITGSGFGHWGIVICPFDDSQEVVRTLHGKVVPWDDGVFFFLEK
jgi:hypothetical protein